MNINKTIKTAFEYVGAVAAGVSGNASPEQGAQIAGNTAEYILATNLATRPATPAVKKQKF